MVGLYDLREENFDEVGLVEVDREEEFVDSFECVVEVSGVLGWVVTVVTIEVSENSD